MTKNEMENKSRVFITEISEILGLGKPIDILKLCATTDLFFKPLEERIVELEKENTELKEIKELLSRLNKEQSESILELRLQIEEMKSNSKHWNETHQGSKIIGLDTANELKTQKQLAKAKEIIKEMLSILPKENIEGIYEITEEAEQFLKEVEE